MEHAALSAGVPISTAFTTCAIDVESSPTYIRVSIAGELDTVDSDQVARLLVEAVNVGRPVVRLELSGLVFADSSAISAILLGARAAESTGVAFQLVNPRPRMQQLLDITGLTEALTVIHEPDGLQEQSPP